MQPHQNNIKDYSSDSPIINEKDDKFSRWKFSKRIAQVISERRDPSSIVIGLYGQWGDGKTSVLNFIQSSLHEDENVVCINFNPWRFGSEAEILEGFFNDIAVALDETLKTKGDTLKSFLETASKATGNLHGVPGVGNRVGSFFSGPNLIEFKERIEKILNDKKKRVLILIDDIDRLEKSEIHSVFRLVKLTADFNHTAYILAFDKDVVAASLQEKYSNINKNAGEAFLEKIIQVPLHLPSIRSNVLRQYCFDGLNEALSIADIKLSNEQGQEFARDFELAFGSCLTTPRKAKLYGNTVLFSLPILKGEVNPVDLMLIEGIRIFYPPLYEVIRNNENMFIGIPHQEQYKDREDEKKLVIKLINEALDSCNVVDKSNCIDLLQNLFPKLAFAFLGINYKSFTNNSINIEQRICSDNYFSRYFTYSIAEDDFPDIEIVKLAKLINKPISINKDNNPLAEVVNNKNSGSVIRKLTMKARSFNEIVSSNLAMSISLESDKFPNPEQQLSIFSTPFN